MPTSSNFEKTAWYLIGATRGGPMRAIILRELLARPMNVNQLAEKIGVDYKTVSHHIQLLLRTNWITGSNNKYGEVFFTTFTGEDRLVFERICSKLEKSFNTRRK